jgi:LacI family transcriptional regulator
VAATAEERRQKTVAETGFGSHESSKQGRMPVTTTGQKRLQRPPRVTIGQLADALGLAKGTVSRALNDYPDISESTRLRVKRAAQRMGYRPLSHAQAIRTGRTRSLGLVLQSDVHDGMRPFLAEFLSGLTQEASREGWTLTVSTAPSEAELAGVLRRLVEEHKADGFVLPRTMIEDPRVALLRALGVPFVLFGRTGDGRGCSWYDILGEEAMREAVLRLASFGHRRIAFVNGGNRYNYSVLREAGYRAGLREAGLAEAPELMRRDALTPQEGAAATRALLALPEPPTAIVFAVDMAALGAWPVAAELGLAIGRELSVIGYDGVPEGALARPSLTSFDVDTKRAGERLAHLLIRQIRGEEAEALRETERARLREGGSDGPPELTSSELARRLRALRQHVTRTDGRMT